MNSGEETSRRYVPNLINEKHGNALEYTISDLLRKIDPSATVDPVAENLLLDIADDFIDYVVTLSCEMSKAKNKKEVSKEEVEYVISEYKGESSGIGDRPFTPHLPSENHQKRIQRIEMDKQGN